MLRIALGQCQQSMRDRIVRKIREIVVILVDLNDLVQTTSFKSQRFGEHLIDGGAANNRKMTEIVVIRLKK